MNEVILDSFRHNSWATRELIGFCRPLTAEQLATKGVGTFGDIVATLNHIVGSDGSYAQRMADRSLDWIDEDTANFDLLDARVVEVAELWERVLAAPFDTERVIIIDQGVNATRAGIFLAQAINHANHHREQVCAILTALGIEPPSIQAWEYAWATGRIWEQ